MAMVPQVINETQRRDGLSGQRFKAPDMGAMGQAYASGLKKMGGAISNVADDLDQIALFHDKTNAEAADNAYTDFVRQTLHGEDGFYSRKLGDARDGAQGVLDALEKRTQEALDAAKSPREREMLRGILQTRNRQEFTSVTRYAGEQAVAYRQVQTAARIENFATDYAVNYERNPDQARVHWSAMQGAIAEKLDDDGVNDADTRRMIVSGIEKKAHQRVFDNFLVSNPLKADEYLSQNREAFGESAAAAEAQLFPKLVDITADDLVDRVTKTVVDMPAGAAPDGTPRTGGTAVQILPQGWKAADQGSIAPVDNAKAVAEELFPNVTVTSWKRSAGAAGNAGSRSHHVRGGAAIDVAPISGMTFEQYVQRYRDAGYNVIEWIDETDKETAARTGATGPHWHVVIGKGGKSSGGAVSTSAATREGTTQERVAAANLAIDGDPAIVARGPEFVRQVKRTAEARLKSLAIEERQQENERHADEEERALEAVEAMGGMDNLTDPSRQIPNWSSLPVDRRVQYMGIAQNNRERAVRGAAAGARVETDWQFYSDVVGMAPAQILRQYSVGELAAKLDEVELKEVLKLARGKGDGSKSSQKAWAAKDILSTSATYLEAAGIKKTDAAKRAQFAASMMAWATQHQAQMGAWPDEQAVERNAIRMLQQGTFTGADGKRAEGYGFQSPSGRLSMNITKADRDELQAYFNRTGRRTNVSDMDAGQVQEALWLVRSAGGSPRMFGR